jgi:hypothetical protein
MTMDKPASDEMESRIQEGKATTEEIRSEVKERVDGARTDFEQQAEEARAELEQQASKDRSDLQRRQYEARGEAERADDRLGQMLDNARTREADAAAHPKGFFARIKATLTGRG